MTLHIFNAFLFQYELIEFRNVSLTHCDQYRWLQVDYQIGVFISRSSVNFVSIKKIWFMSVLQVRFNLQDICYCYIAISLGADL
jgi:battenin